VRCGASSSCARATHSAGERRGVRRRRPSLSFVDDGTRSRAS
jgi:hypothetical protein